MKTIVIYYSLSGNNRLLAKTLQQRFNCVAHELRPLKRRTKLDLVLDAFLYRKPPNDPVPYDLSMYERVILVGPIWNARIAAPLRSFAWRHRGLLGNYAFVTACGGRPGQATRIWRELHRFTGRAPTELLELDAQSLLQPELRVGLNASRYRWTLEDMSHFGPQLDRFVAMMGGPDSPPTIEDIDTLQSVADATAERTPAPRLARANAATAQPMPSPRPLSHESGGE